MMRRTCGKLGLLVGVLALLAVFPAAALATGTGTGKKNSAVTRNGNWEDEALAGPEETSIADPLEPLNRFFFQFNDRLYFWVLKPVASHYAKVVPADIRTTIVNFFNNLLEPMRMANCLLQGKPRRAGIDLSRFVINSTVGIAGLADPAKNEFGLQPRNTDMGLTFGHYGLGGGIYFVWPFMGPSNLRDSIGAVGDFFLEPLDYIVWNDLGAGVGLSAGDTVNRTSFRIGDYEAFKKAALDPYLAMRNAYQQYRRSMIEGKLEKTSQPFSTGELPAPKVDRHEAASPAAARNGAPWSSAER